MTEDTDEQPGDKGHVRRGSCPHGAGLGSPLTTPSTQVLSPVNQLPGPKVRDSQGASATGSEGPQAPSRPFLFPGSNLSQALLVSSPTQEPTQSNLVRTKGAPTIQKL